MEWVTRYHGNMSMLLLIHAAIALNLSPLVREFPEFSRCLNRSLNISVGLPPMIRNLWNIIRHFTGLSDVGLNKTHHVSHNWVFVLCECWMCWSDLETTFPNGICLFSYLCIKNCFSHCISYPFAALSWCKSATISLYRRPKQASYDTYWILYNGWHSCHSGYLH